MNKNIFFGIILLIIIYLIFNLKHHKDNFSGERQSIPRSSGIIPQIRFRNQNSSFTQSDLNIKTSSVISFLENRSYGSHSVSSNTQSTSSNPYGYK